MLFSAITGTCWNLSATKIQSRRKNNDKWFEPCSGH